MSCGIYILTFIGTSEVYIGQSINIEQRYTTHIRMLKDRTHSLKMLKAYDLYGVPNYSVLLECARTELDDNENEAIQVYDAVDNGFNTLYESTGYPTYYGDNSPVSKYSNDRILEVLDIICDTDLTYLAISIRTGIPIDSIISIAIGKNHKWLSKVNPTKYAIMMSKKYTRKAKQYAIISDKQRADNRGIVYPKIKSPKGVEYTVGSPTIFAKEHGLAANHLVEVLRYSRKSHKGWKLA